MFLSIYVYRHQGLTLDLTEERLQLPPGRHPGRARLKDDPRVPSERLSLQMTVV